MYRNDSLLYVLHEEGRARYDTGFQYDYFVKDHLGNVRTVVQSEVSWGSNWYNTGWELMSLASDEGFFDPLDSIRDNNPSGTPNDLQSGLLNGQDPGARIGAAILLHGMAGDQFKMGGYGKIYGCKSSC